MRTPWWTSYFSLMPRNIAIASLGVGSSTIIGWNRLSNAGSFSICSRYSLIVVAPMVRSLPRARAGFKRLPASTAPSAPPAPMMVCSSSMKSMTSPEAFSTSFISAFRRSSNSPRYFAPASIAPRSSASILLPLSDSGTSPSIIFFAKPSTMAVLPTPGSPISTGLFLVRRERICRSLRVSSSRPMTGSMLPSRASLVKS